MKSPAPLQRGPTAEVFNRLAHPGALDTVLRQAVDKAKADGKDIPADLEKNLENISFTDDSISIAAGPAGKLTFRLGDCTPDSDVQYVGDGTPVALILDFKLTPEGVDKSILSIMVQADMPYMLRPMVQGPLRKGLDALTNMLAQIPSWR